MGDWQRETRVWATTTVIAIASVGTSAAAVPASEAPAQVAVVWAVAGLASQPDLPIDVWADVQAVLQFRRALRIVPKGEMFAPGTSLADAVRSCGADLGCMVARLEGTGIRFGLSVTVTLDVEPVLVALRLVDTRAPQVAATEVVRSTRDGAAISKAIRRGSGALLAQAGYRQYGRLLVETAPIGATLLVDPPAPDIDPSQHELLLLPGRYRVLAELADHHAATATVAIDAGRLTTLQLVLPEAPRWWGSWWLWSAVGVAVAGGAAAAVWATTRTGGVCVTGLQGDCDPSP